MSQELEDLGKVEKANFTPNIKAVANTTIATMHLLRELSKTLGIPMEKITSEHIISSLAVSDAEIRALNEKMGQ